MVATAGATIIVYTLLKDLFPKKQAVIVKQTIKGPSELVELIKSLKSRELKNQ